MTYHCQVARRHDVALLLQLFASVEFHRGISFVGIQRGSPGCVRNFRLLEGRWVLLVGLAPIIALENIHNLGINMNSKYRGNQVAHAVTNLEGLPSCPVRKQPLEFGS